MVLPEYEQTSPTNILEIGPGKNPATDIYHHYPDPHITLVDIRPIDADQASIGCPIKIYQNQDIITFLETEHNIPPGGFDVILGFNFFGARLTDEEQQLHVSRHLPDFFRLAYERLRPGGALILEDTYESMRYLEKFIESFLKEYNFREIVISSDRNDFLRPDMWHKDALAVHALK